jgi:AGCS family alanine or glycine:cation symporter
MEIFCRRKSGHTGLSACIAAAGTLIVLAVAIWATLGRIADRAKTSASDVSLQKVLKSGRFVIGIDADFPPMSFVDDEGELTGFDVDVAREVCKRLGVELVRRAIDWDDKEEELDSGAIDCIGSMSVTPVSARDMNLSEPYVKETLIFVVAGDSNVRWLRDLKGKKVGVQDGSTTQEALEALDSYKDIVAVPFKNNMAILRQLKYGKLDAALVDSLAAYYFIYSGNEQYFVLSESLGDEKLAIGFRKNDKELRDKIQHIISGMKADGSLGYISRKWFGSDITIVR